MKEAKKKIGIAAGTIGAAAAACAACCVSIPVIGSLMAWLGLSGLGAAAMGWYLLAAGVSALGLGLLLFVRHRRNASRQPTDSVGDCGCRNSCQT